MNVPDPEGYICTALLVEHPTADGGTAWAAYVSELNLIKGGDTYGEALERAKAEAARIVAKDWAEGVDPLNRSVETSDEPLRQALDDAWAKGHRVGRVPYHGGWLVDFVVCEAP